VYNIAVAPGSAGFRNWYELSRIDLHGVLASIACRANSHEGSDLSCDVTLYTHALLKSVLQELLRL
jgi:hypothetical protein